MNYITSCPECQTQFMLTDEHIKAYRGKVQCGNCEHIFDTKDRLTEISDDIQSAAEYQARIEAESEKTTTETSPTAAASINKDEKPLDEMLNVVLDAVPNLEHLFTNEQEPTLNFQNTDITGAGSEQIYAPIIINDLITDNKLEQPKTKLNGWLILLSLLLLVLAVLQSIYYYRTTIAANYPQFKPLLSQACDFIQCKIALPQQLDMLSIDDSDMQEDDTHQDVIKFSSLLINNAPYTQALPNIELTLTTADDEPVLRKTISPAEYLAANIDAASGIASREEIRVLLNINVKDLKVAGYRVLLNY